MILPLPVNNKKRKQIESENTQENYKKILLNGFIIDYNQAKTIGRQEGKEELTIFFFLWECIKSFKEEHLLTDDTIDSIVDTMIIKYIPFANSTISSSYQKFLWKIQEEFRKEGCFQTQIKTLSQLCRILLKNEKVKAYTEEVKDYTIIQEFKAILEASIQMFANSILDKQRNGSCVIRKFIFQPFFRNHKIQKMLSIYDIDNIQTACAKTVLSMTSSKQESQKIKGSKFIVQLILKNIALWKKSHSDFVQSKGFSVKQLSYMTSDKILNYCRIMGQDLKYLNLGGTQLSPDAIKQICEYCPNLECLDLLSFPATDEHLKELTALSSSLMYLSLGENKKISNEGIKYLQGFIHLRQLDLTRCIKITDKGFEYLNTLYSLEYLQLTGCKITSNGLNHLVTLPSLKFLDLTHCNQINNKGCRSLSSMPLQGLNLSYQKITPLGLKCLKESSLPLLASLEHLIWMKCPARKENKGFEYLKYFTSLKNLILTETSDLNDKGLELLKSIPSLEYLNLRDCKNITNEGFKHLTKLPSLQKLDLSGCDQITDETLKILKDSPSLKYLILDRCKKITREGFKYLNSIAFSFLIDT